jgi:hypothetical protein
MIDRASPAREVFYGRRPRRSEGYDGVALEGEYLVRRRRFGFLALLSAAVFSSLVTFLVTWTIASARPMNVTFTPVNVVAQATPAASTPSTTTVANPTTSGQVGLTEAQLRSAVLTVGGSIYWAGSMSSALYTYNHLAGGQDFVRYLPNGKGLSDTTQNYRVIATYHDPKAYATMLAAAKLGSGISKTNPDGSIIYYAKSTPTHVYLAYKNLPFQIEIFDPAPGESLKLATTPGIISAIK